MNKWDSRFLALARLVSTWSKDPSTKTGSVIVRPNKVVAGLGFNGFAQGAPDDPAFYSVREEKYSRIIHCEVNALLFANGPVVGSTLYTFPFLSCDRCCVQMIQAGIKRFVAPEPTKSQLERWGSSFDRTRRYCAEAGVEVSEFSLVGEPRFQSFVVDQPAGEQ